MNLKKRKPIINRNRIVIGILFISLLTIFVLIITVPDLKGITLSKLIDFKEDNPRPSLLIGKEAPFFKPLFSPAEGEDDGGVGLREGNCDSIIGPNNYYVDIDSLCGLCDDIYSKQENSVTTPWCTLVHAASVSQPGETFYVQDGKYNQAFNFVVSGTSSLPITYSALGDNVILGVFIDIVDEDFIQTGGYNNVYEIDLPVVSTFYNLYQTYFDLMIVDDPVPTNPSYFTIVQEDGPMAITPVSTLNDVEAYAGTMLIQDNKIYVHPYGSKVPSSVLTDFVLNYDRDKFRISSDIHDIIINGFKLHYNSNNNLMILGYGNTISNLYVTSGLDLRGHDNYLENITVTHKIYKNDPNHEWDYDNSGSGFTDMGTNNIIKNLHVSHSWNLLNMEYSVGSKLINLRLHGSPNHCFQPKHVQGLTIQNAVIYNCQDSFGYSGGNVVDVIYEGITTFGNIYFQEIPAPVRNIIYRNIIFDSCSIRVGTVVTCDYESTITIENSIFMCDQSEDFIIQHCIEPGNIVTYNSISEYLANCGSNCMTLNNVDVINQGYENIIVGGQWIHETDDPWDFHITDVNSIAYDAGSVNSEATEDFEGDSRPQGTAYDIGADEYVSGIQEICDNGYDDDENGLIDCDDLSCSCEQIYNFEQGLNFIAMPLSLSDMSVENVFSELISRDTLDSIYTYDNGWKVYHTDPDKSQFNTLNIIETKKAYIIVMKNIDSLTLEGNTITEIIDLNVGWNLVGISEENPILISDYLGSNIGYVVSVWSWDGADNYVELDPYVDNFEPGNLYWIEASESFRFAPELGIFEMLQKLWQIIEGVLFT